MLKAPQTMIFCLFLEFSWTFLGRSLTSDESYFGQLVVRFIREDRSASNHRLHIAMPIASASPFASGSTLASLGVKCSCIHVVQDGAVPSIGKHTSLYPLAISWLSLPSLSHYFFKSSDRSLFSLTAWSYKVNHYHPDTPHFRALGSWLYYAVQYRRGSFSDRRFQQHSDSP